MTKIHRLVLRYIVVKLDVFFPICSVNNFLCLIHREQTCFRHRDVFEIILRVSKNYGILFAEENPNFVSVAGN